MRVIGGYLGGRIFDSPGGHRTHPMSEKARGAVFNALGDIDGLTVLDAYAGSGALAIEAISRGADTVTAIDIDIEAVKTISRNLKLLDIEDRVRLLRKNISGWSSNHAHKKFDIVLADPPYNDIKPNVLAKLTRHLLPGGIFVLSWPGREKPREFDGLARVSINPLGDIQLIFYRKAA